MRAVTLEQVLTYQHFKTWLLSRDAVVIGIPQDAGVCPLAIYLRESLDTEEAVRVGSTKVEYTLRGRQSSLELPFWAVKFVAGVDRAGAPLTGREAANLLLPQELLTATDIQPEAAAAPLQGAAWNAWVAAIAHLIRPGLRLPKPGALTR